MVISVHEEFLALFAPDQQELLTKIGEQLVLKGYTLIEGQITEVIVADYSDEGKRIDILSAFEEAVTSVLFQYGIKINDTKKGNLNTLYKMLLLVDRIEQNENHEDIVAICQSGDTSNDVLINLSEYLKDLDWLVLEEHVQEVLPTLIRKIKEHHQKYIEGELIDKSHSEERTLQYLENRSNFDVTLVKDLIGDRQAYGFDLLSALTLYREILLNVSNDADLAQLLMCVGLASNVPDEVVIETLQRWVMRYIDNPDRVMSVSRKLTMG